MSADEIEQEVESFAEATRHMRKVGYKRAQPFALPPISRKRGFSLSQRMSQC